MNKINHVNITSTDTFEKEVYAAFPESLHEHVEHSLFYESEELRTGEMTMQKFKERVLELALWQEKEQAQSLADTAIFEGVKSLLAEDKIKDKQFAAELEQDINKGEDSLLARFIWAQSVSNAMDAAISFLAWKRAKELTQLEEDFNVCLDKFREAKEPEFFCISEGNMSLINFSVMS